MTQIGHTPSHGGLLLPLDMFRPTMLASVLAEGLVSKARNIVDANLVITRHPQTQLLLVTVEGSVVGDDAAGFWHEHADLAVVASQVAPRQVFLYYVVPSPPDARREGFLVAQRGQVLAADDASADRMPPGATDEDWPVARLCSQMQIDPAELAGGFAGGPSIQVSLMEPGGDDQAMLMTLAGQPPPDIEGDGGLEAPAGGPQEPKGPSPSEIADADAKRRAREQAEEAAALRERADEIASDLRHGIDGLGIVVVPTAELAETDVLEALIVAEVDGELPDGLPAELAAQLQGKRVDVVVKVDFLSEVLVENTPLSRAVFEERATTADIGGHGAQTLEVLAPRLGYGTLVQIGSARAFVSRKPELTLPEDLLAQVLTV